MLYKREGEIKPEFQYMDNSFDVSVDERKYYRGLDRYDYCPVFDVSYHSLYTYYWRKHYDTVLYVRCLLKGK